MPYLVFVFFLFLFPWVAIAGIFLIIILLSMGFTAKHLPGMLFSPAKLSGILFSKKIRANHGISHGTISVLEERFGRLEIEGLPDEEGFSLRGAYDPEEVLLAAKNALFRIKAGEKSLALSPRCPFSAALFYYCVLICCAFLALSFGFSIMSAAGVIFCVFLSARIAVPWIQYRLIMPLELDWLEISGSEMRSQRKRFFGIEMEIPSSVFVRTRSRGEPLVAEVVS
jgi:hypothetical protein